VPQLDGAAAKVQLQVLVEGDVGAAPVPDAGEGVRIGVHALPAQPLLAVQVVHGRRVRPRGDHGDLVGEGGVAEGVVAVEGGVGQVGDRAVGEAGGQPLDLLADLGRAAWA
jgi:hypothetical protein